MNSQFILVDLRDEAAFLESHLPGAVNIPFATILDNQSIRTLRKSNQIPVFYSDKESQAQTARILLLSKGIGNDIRVLGGSYETARKYAIDQFQPSFAGYKEEKARFDFVRFMGGVAPPAQRQQPAGAIPAMRQETIAVQGGC